MGLQLPAVQHSYSTDFHALFRRQPKIAAKYRTDVLTNVSLCAIMKLERSFLATGANVNPPTILGFQCRAERAFQDSRLRVSRLARFLEIVSDSHLIGSTKDHQMERFFRMSPYRNQSHREMSSHTHNSDYQWNRRVYERNHRSCGAQSCPRNAID